MNDLKFAIRQLLKNPGFTTVAVLTLALGIGANTAIFSVVNAVLLRPLPYPEPGQLVQLRADRSGSPPSSVIGSRTFIEVKAQSQSLARIAAYSGGDMTLTGAGPAERVVSGAVTGDFFPLLGIQPALGRNFTREEDTPNGPKAAILGHGLWQSRFGGDADVLDRTITLNQQSYTVVGVLPARFQYPERFQLWTPLALGETSAGGGMRLLKAIARLKPGVTLQQAQTELQTIAQRDQPARPGGAGPVGDRSVSSLTLIGLHEQVVGDVTLETYTPVIEDMGGAMSFVIRVTGEPAGLISAVRGVVAEVEPNQPLHNVMTMEQRLANTTTSRRLNTTLLGSFAGVALLLAVVGIYGVMSYAVTQRRREIGVRMALGAQKSDVLGLVVGGGLRLTLVGVAIGLISAFALTRYLSSLLYSVKATDPLTFLSVTVALTGVALLACWLPARRAARTDPMEALRYE